MNASSRRSLWLGVWPNEDSSWSTLHGVSHVGKGRHLYSANLGGGILVPLGIRKSTSSARRSTTGAFYSKSGSNIPTCSKQKALTGFYEAPVSAYKSGVEIISVIFLLNIYLVSIYTYLDRLLIIQKR